MPVIIENSEICIRRNIHGYYSFSRDTSLGLIDIGADVTIEPKFGMSYSGDGGDMLNCILKNNRTKKLIYNYTANISVCQAEKEPIKLITRSREKLELEGKQEMNLEFPVYMWPYFKEKTSVDFIFEFHFEEIQTSAMKASNPSNVAWLTDSTCLYDDENFKDLKIKIGEDVLTAHRLVLTTKSKVFYAMLQHDTKEKRESMIEIEDCNVDSFKAFLKYCYTGEIEDLDNKAVDLLILAEKYDVQGLKEKCEDYLCGITSKDNAIAHLIGAYLSNSTLLKATALAKIKPCVKEILKSQEARSLNDYPLLFKEIVLMFDA